MLDHSCQVQRHELADRKDDLYETPSCAVEALLRVEKLPMHLWEPACGRGNIVTVLKNAGYSVYSSDLVNYGTGDWGVDFLMEWRLPHHCEAIITNPPFKLAEEFVDHALALCPKVIMLLRLAFLESERRCAILDTGLLARIYVFRKRLPMMHRDGWQGKKANSGVAFAWFIWDKSHKGPTTIQRISWEDNRDARSPRMERQK